MQVVEFLHVKPGKGSAFVRTKLKSVQSGNVVEKTFRAGESVQQAILEKSNLQHTYVESGDYVFMNMTSFEEMFKKYVSTPINEKNRKQAFLPKKAKIYLNNYGTASGMLFKKNKNLFFSLPGVPHEMKMLLNDSVIPELKSNFSLPYIYHKTILTYGLGESIISKRIESWENNLPENIKLAYLPGLGRVRLRLSSKGLWSAPPKCMERAGLIP